MLIILNSIAFEGLKPKLKLVHTFNKCLFSLFSPYQMPGTTLIIRNTEEWNREGFMFTAFTIHLVDENTSKYIYIYKLWLWLVTKWKWTWGGVEIKGGLWRDLQDGKMALWRFGGRGNQPATHTVRSQRARERGSTNLSKDTPLGVTRH